MELRITQSALIRTVLSDLNRQRARLADLQEQAASGLRVNRPSDDPGASAAALLLRAGIDATAQYDRNVALTRGRISASESALSASNDVLIRARELALAGANGVHDATSRSLIAAEVETLHARLLSEANTRASGAYVFAGFASDAAPFVASGPFVPAAPAPSVAFAGDANEIEVAIDEGVTAKASLDGRRVFLGDADGDGSADGGREDLFALLGDLRDALVANDAAGVRATLPRFDAGLRQLGIERAQLGASETRLDDWEDRLAARDVELRERLSVAQDADVAEVFSELVNQQTALQAVLTSAQRLIQPTLLDFLV